MIDSATRTAAAYRLRAKTVGGQTGAWSQPVSVAAAAPPTTAPLPTPIGQQPTPAPPTLAVGCQNLLQLCVDECQATQSLLLECTCVQQRHLARCAAPTTAPPPGVTGILCCFEKKMSKKIICFFR